MIEDEQSIEHFRPERAPDPLPTLVIPGVAEPYLHLSKGRLSWLATSPAERRAYRTWFGRGSHPLAAKIPILVRVSATRILAGIDAAIAQLRELRSLVVSGDHEPDEGVEIVPLKPKAERPPIDELTRERARRVLRKSGFR